MHLTEEGLLQIINLRASINLGFSNLPKANYPNSQPIALFTLLVCLYNCN